MANSKGNSLLFTFFTVSTFITLFVIYKKRRKKIAIARAFIGQKEISGNLGFQSDEMERLMSDIGWNPGDAWCVYFVKMVWWLSATPFQKELIKKNLSGSSQKTWENVSNSPAFVTSRVPRVGDMAIWQTYENGSPKHTGHAGVVMKVGFNDFTTIEGNTNLSGSNEGIEVAKKVRTYDFDKTNGLRLKGFVRFA